MRSEDISLNDRYAFHIILYLKEKGEIPISKFVPEVATNYRAIRDIIERMEEEGIVEYEKQYSPKKKFTVSLTDLGEDVAQKLIEIEELMEE